MMEERERVVLQTLKKIPKAKVILVGAYAVNAYVPPRFSIDCDLVIFGMTEKIEAILKEEGFVKIESGEVRYGGYVRYYREREKVSFDLLVDSVQDRETGIIFEAELIRRNSAERVTVGRTNPIRIKMRIADPEMLFAMKFVTARKQDVRDVFMLSGEGLNRDLLKRMVHEKCDDKLIKKRNELIRKSVSMESYRDSIHGPYGKMPDERFNLCKNNLLDFLSVL